MDRYSASSWIDEFEVDDLVASEDPICLPEPPNPDILVVDPSWQVDNTSKLVSSLDAIKPKPNTRNKNSCGGTRLNLITKNLSEWQKGTIFYSLPFKTKIKKGGKEKEDSPVQPMKEQKSRRNFQGKQERSHRWEELEHREKSVFGKKDRQKSKKIRREREVKTSYRSCIWAATGVSSHELLHVPNIANRTLPLS